VEASGAEWRGLHGEQRVTRLGEGQAGTGIIQPAAMRRTAEVVAAFCRRVEDLRVRDVRIVATSAIREAANGAEFLAQVCSSTGRRARLRCPRGQRPGSSGGHPV
jgi:exopolyphosphatase/guanosine-5'-triphosphate,3'-diphosphate pyrophosphatase